MLAQQLPSIQIKEFSVQEISNRIKEILEDNLGVIRIKGEISGFKLATSGHVYFNLKDNFAVLSCTCWKYVFTKVKFNLADGLEVVIIGKITSYPGQSKYQLSVENIEPAGAGAIMQIFNERKERLAKEGLFDQKNKKSIPFMPQRIGIITSLTGAVIQDIIHRISNRSPTKLLIWPSMVQGDMAASQIIQGIEELNKLTVNQPEVIIIARGGGSIEDLWCFNEEEIVRAIVNSKIPIISAIGHETDYTLADFAADLRAPTPTAAAELATPVLTDLQYNLISLSHKLLRSTQEQLKYYNHALASHTKTIRYALNYIELVGQKLDELNFRLIESLPNLLKFKTANLARFSMAVLSPAKILNYSALRLKHQQQYLSVAIGSMISNLSHKLNINNVLLNSLSYHNVLKRGYTIIETTDGKFVTSQSAAQNKEKLNIKFWDGKVTVSKN